MSDSTSSKLAAAEGAASSSASAAKATATSSRWNVSQRLLEAIQKRPVRSGILAGFAATMLYSSYQNRARKIKEEAEDAKTKKVLVLPFDRMKIVEESRGNSLRSLLSSSSVDPTSNRTVEMSVDECVRLIHQAAADPQIVALHGVMGHGQGFSTGGWAHVEEIRNALKVFSQAHRRHYEPGKPGSTAQDAPKKPMYLYTNTFAAPTASGGSDMKDYYLASMFSHIHLQSQGDLNLLGLHTTNTFYRDFLAKYGITVHVWKHGAYKNFANQFTHTQYNQPHAENVVGIMRGIQKHILENLFEARFEQLKEYQPKTFWPMVHSAGSLPAPMAQRIGFVDFLAPRNPLDDLMDYQKNENKREVLREKWQNSNGAEGEEKDLVPLTDLESFPATKPITIMEYARKTKQKKQGKEQEWQIYERLQKLPSGMQSMLGLFGMPSPHFNMKKEEFDEKEAKGRKEQIAVLKISGPITDATARKLEQPLRKLKQAQDKISAVVLRVDSPGGAITACETIHQQLQDLPQKVVVSYGNVSASGGYYISANSERIFASPTTITGSIGVVMLRADLRGLAHQWGINFDSIPSSDLSGIFDPFFPINSRMKENFANYCDRAYMHFKTLVSQGRGLSMEQVEQVAQGRVWTGEQAVENGLVDELGGLDRAISYCQRNLTESGHAKIVEWPPKKTLFRALMDRKNKSDEDDDDFDNVEVPSMMESIVQSMVLAGLGPWILGDIKTSGDVTQSSNKGSAMASLERMLQQGRLPAAMSGVMLTIDENAAIRCLLEQHDVPDVFGSLPPGFWES